MKTLAVILSLCILGGTAQAQEDDDKKVKFNFKRASVSAVVEYLTKVTPWIWVKDSSVSSKTKVTASSDTEVPLDKLLAEGKALLQGKF